MLEFNKTNDNFKVDDKFHKNDQFSMAYEIFFYKQTWHHQTQTITDLKQFLLASKLNMWSDNWLLR
jgi:hypothetical protein